MLGTLKIFTLLVMVYIEFFKITSANRTQRYLVHPPPGQFAPTKVQLILGLGLPMEVDVSTIIGYVMKFNYKLPYNASYFTNPYVRYDRSTGSNIMAGKIDVEKKNSKSKDDSRSQGYENYQGYSSRWEVYKLVESFLESFNSGKSCLLRVVCQIAENPLDTRHSLLGQMLQVLLTPTSTREVYADITNQEYKWAEEAGREYPGQCRQMFPECSADILDYLTEIH
ncbi:uncharacterized protein LOC112493635 [Cephus cinctus]|uniref:Uncharacterized protein LOC112493635 n=1 Tax=Cephus cinctus TaxID=211228 RepID=A0AAJ7R729_CEPCN|nr:uncharacterized protein LOC112493635 [Cephus cinctus]